MLGTYTGESVWEQMVRNEKSSFSCHSPLMHCHEYRLLNESSSDSLLILRHSYKMTLNMLANR